MDSERIRLFARSNIVPLALGGVGVCIALANLAVGSAGVPCPRTCARKLCRAFYPRKSVPRPRNRPNGKK